MLPSDGASGIHPALSSTYFLVAACISVVGVGTIGDEEKVLMPATFSFPVLCTTALSSAFVQRAVDVAVLTGKSAISQSFVALLSDVSLNRILSLDAGVPFGIQVGKITSIVF